MKRHQHLMSIAMWDNIRCHLSIFSLGSERTASIRFRLGVANAIRRCVPPTKPHGTVGLVSGVTHHTNGSQELIAYKERL